MGEIEVLIYNVRDQFLIREPLDMTYAELNEAFHVEVVGAFAAAKAVLPAMRQQGGGLIIYLSSGCVQRPDVSGVSYQATKHGMSGLAHGTFEEEREKGIRTTVIFPGLTDTPLVLKRPTPTPPEVMAKALQPEDVSRACLFVAMQAARARVPELVLLPAGL